MFFSFGGGGGGGGSPFGGGPADDDDGPSGPVDNEKLYKVLGVEKTASTLEIKKAFRKLAMVHHPDKGGDEEKVR